MTAVTREGSENTIPDGVIAKKVNYDEQSSLVEALKGQDALIITMSVMAPPTSSMKLVEAAAAAKVPWILPNEFGIESADHEGLRNDTVIGSSHVKIRSRIEELGKSSWMGLVCGFWYEFSLGGTAARYGFDFPSRTVTFYSGGNTTQNTSTWPQVGRAVANLLSLKTRPDDANDKSPSLQDFKNKAVFISSFNVSQRDMFDSVLRVTGDKKEDWTVKDEDVKERYQTAMKKFQEDKDFLGFAVALYARPLYPDDSGNYEKRHGLSNDVLGLPKEDLDKYTKLAFEFQKGTYK